MKSTKKHVQPFEDSYETKVGGSVTSNVASIAPDVMKSFWDQFLLGGAKSTKDMIMGDLDDFSHGKKANKMSGDLQEGQAVSLKTQQEKQEKKSSHLTQHQEYFREIKNPESASMAESRIASQRIESILVEIKKLANATTDMQILFKDVSNETVPVNPGTYHVNFFEWVLIVVRSARQKMEDSSSWLAMFASKKKQRQYGAMAKKHGTMFTLSSERTAATQTG